MSVREAMLEKYLINRVRELGGKTAKMTVQGQRGWPDRLVILPGGNVALVELKRPKKGAWSWPQKQMFTELDALGMVLGALSSVEEIDDFLGKMRWDHTKRRLWAAGANAEDD